MEQEIEEEIVEDIMSESEETQYVYHIPSGTYKVTNTGEYMSQISIYSDETHITEEGWEEPAENIFVAVLDVGYSKEFTIGDEQYIEIHEPAKFKLEEQ